MPFFGAGFMRRGTSGERLNQGSNTAAHRKLPFGTIVKVTNIKNILIISDFGEVYDTLPKKPKCLDFVTSNHDI